jgi:hypothetical protein
MSATERDRPTSEPRTKVQKRAAIARAVVAIVLALIILVAQVPPLSRWSGHYYLIAAAVAIIAVDWAVLASRRRNPLYVALAVYTVFVLVGTILKEIVHAPPRALLIAVAIATVLSGAAALVSAAARGMRQTELDRFIFSEASSIAFFATILGLLTADLLAAWLDFDPPGPMVFAMLGGGAWVVAAVALRRRFR